MIKKGIEVLLLLFFVPGVLLGQTVEVIDSATLQPVEDVYIYNLSNSKAAITDAAGETDLSRFAESDTLIFQHPSFKQKVRTLPQLEQQNFVVKLTERTVMMDEIYVSANKREQRASKIPRKVMQIQSEAIAFSNPQTAADLLQASGEVFVQKSQMGGGSPMIRGFAANSVLIAVDGIRMNNAIFRSGNLQNIISVDPNSIASAEVIFGPGAIIYGSDALGGVMNFETKNAKLASNDEGPFVKVNALSRFGSANNERTLHADANLGFASWGVLTSVTYSNFDNLHAGAQFFDDYPDFGKRREYIIRRNGSDQVIQNDDVTEQVFSEYAQLNLMQKIRYKPAPDWDLNYAFHLGTTTDIPRYDRLIERENGNTGSLKNAEWYYGPQIWMMHVLKANNYTPTDFYDRIQGTLSYQWFQESRNDRDFQSPVLRNREENVDAAIANIDFDKQFHENSILYYGFEGIYNYVKSNALTTNIETGQQAPAATRYPDGGSDYTQLAAYGKYQQDLSPDFTGIAGLRYSHVMLHAEFSDQFYDFPFNEIDISTGALNGSLGFTWRPADGVQLNLNGSTGFRAPNVDDAAKVFDSEPGTVIVPNSDLKPEYSYNIDAALVKHFGDRARLEINTFYTWLKDAMVRRDFQFSGQDSIVYDGELSKVEAVVNAGKAYVYGASTTLSFELGQYFGFDSHITFTDGKDISNNEPLRHVAPVFGQAGLTYKRSRLKARLYTQFNGKKDIRDFSPSEQRKTHLYTEDGTPGWATLNLKTSYQINGSFRLNAGVENILDQHYRPYSSGISAPGRNFIFSLKATF